MTDSAKPARYRARDLLLVPGLLSLARVPLAVAFPFSLPRPAIAFAVLCTAGATDVLDGWYARRFGQATATGAVVDPVTDKLFVGVVVATLALTDRLSPLGVLMLAARELGELPLIGWFVLTRRGRTHRGHPAANIPGKAATVLQFATVTAAMFESRYTPALLAATAAVGGAAALIYWLREIRRPRGE